jgi:hypothetical protein
MKKITQSIYGEESIRRLHTTTRDRFIIFFSLTLSMLADVMLYIKNKMKLASYARREEEKEKVAMRTAHKPSSRQKSDSRAESITTL